MNTKKQDLILIVDDNPENLTVLGNILRNEGYDPVAATSGFQALEFIKVEKPNLILLDIMMPEMNGFEVCQTLKRSHTNRHIPVIFLSARSETNDIVKGFKTGGVDYITKPFQTQELLARVNTHLSLESMKRKLEEQNRQLTVMAQTDPLTHLYNRRYFMDQLRREINRSIRYDRPLSLINLDIDHFKSVNDRFGHDVGDHTLIKFCETGLKVLRKTDLFARIGGEEFSVILPESNMEMAMGIAERLRSEVEKNELQAGDMKFRITVSIGIASLGENEKDMNLLIKQADQALYSAKRKGRNRMEKYAPQTSQNNL